MSAKPKQVNGIIHDTGDLRKVLSETISDVRSGAMQPNAAKAVADLVTKMIQSARLDLDFMRFTTMQTGKPTPVMNQPMTLIGKE